MSAILQTRPQGEKSAERALESRGVPTLRPVEIIETRKRTAGGKQVVVPKERRLMPGYVVAVPDAVTLDGKDIDPTGTKHRLDVALGDMAMQPRKDVTRVVGWTGEAVLADTFRKHQTVRAEIDTCKLKVNEFARLIDGAFKGFQVRIQAMTPTKVRFMLNGIPMTAPIEHCEAI